MLQLNAEACLECLGISRIRARLTGKGSGLVSGRIFHSIGSMTLKSDAVSFGARFRH